MKSPRPFAVLLAIILPASFSIAGFAAEPANADRATENPARANQAAPAPATVDKVALKKELAAMEDAFCAMGKSQGLLAAFKYFAAPDVSFIDTDPRKWRGLPAVIERIGPDVPGESLQWSAYYTDVSDDGSMGFNYGRYEARSPGKDGQVNVHTGWFLTIWKRQPDGSWKYVMDNGAPDHPAPKPATPATPAPAKPAGS